MHERIKAIDIACPACGSSLRDSTIEKNQCYNCGLSLPNIIELKLQGLRFMWDGLEEGFVLAKQVLIKLITDNKDITQELVEGALNKEWARLKTEYEKI